MSSYSRLFPRLMVSHAFQVAALIIILLSEFSSLQYTVLLTVSWVFNAVTITNHGPYPNLISSLVFILYVILGVFISTSSLLLFFLMFELSLLPVSIMILVSGYQPEKLNSVLYLVMYTVVCSTPFLYFAVYSNSSLRSGFSSLPRYSGLLVCLSFMVKSPLYTLHAWLPKAHVEASTIGSMLLAGVILKMGSYGLLLLSPYLGSLTLIYVYLTLVGGVVCSVLCCRAWDMKSLVAYSSVVHMGVVTLGALSGLELGYWVACGMLVGHSLLSPLLFILASELYLARGSRSFVYGHSSSCSSSFLLCLSLCSGLSFGLPPFLNFWVEVGLFSLMGSTIYFSLLPLMLSAFLSFLYSLLFYILSSGGPSSSVLSHSSSFYIYLPPLLFSLALAIRPSMLLF